MVFSISATTRKRRGSEIENKDYFFISEREFVNKINNNEFVEWEKFYDYFYGTLRSFIDGELNKGNSVVLEVDVKGAVNIKQAYPNSVLIFIMPPSLEELKARLIQRKTENENDLKKRFERAEMELSYKDKFDYVVINENLEKAKQKVLEIIENEMYKEIKNGSPSN